ncbi:hypothetical protein OESDEN_13063 [Oesophagostomum dentatum]|uniref:Uncharacterized protein n=1 Tax=Oesophagostomum dentatum TaxID=61180 RepID=A0A0B1STI3_OESDE|nr:hypothetical protein OESDEN_13063 [Oesophagostomum dentatum]
MPEFATLLSTLMWRKRPRDNQNISMLFDQQLIFTTSVKASPPHSEIKV